MKPIVISLMLIFMMGVVKGQSNSNTMKTEEKLVCKLTAAELRERKKTVIAELKSALIEKKETDNGMKYKFEGTDTMIDLVTSFIKTERTCCDFFDFNVSISEGKLWLELSGPPGTKEFIHDEMGF